MKFIMISNPLKVSRKTVWHTWFAWFPVRVSPTEVAWLETVERKGRKVTNMGHDGDSVSWWDWKYRSASNA